MKDRRYYQKNPPPGLAPGHVHPYWRNHPELVKKVIQWLETGQGDQYHLLTNPPKPAQTVQEAWDEVTGKEDPNRIRFNRCQSEAFAEGGRSAGGVATMERPRKIGTYWYAIDEFGRLICSRRITFAPE